MQANIATLQSQMMDMLNKQNEEARLRANSPALQDAWDKYQTVVRLATE